MKALKEKRIGLRSLLRRGLVILSLFALVFASCDSTDNEVVVPTGPTNPPVYQGAKPADIKIISWPEYDSYEGLELDLRGLEVRVFYEGNPPKNETITIDNAKFSTYPKTAVGVIGKDNVGGGTLYWVPQVMYTLLWTSPLGDVFSTVLDLQDPARKDGLEPTVVPIPRADAWTGSYLTDQPYKYGWAAAPGLDAEDQYNWSKGLRLTGDLKQTIYADDNPTWSKYTLQMDYTDKTLKEINLESRIVDGKIVPNYIYGPADLATGKLGNPLGAIGDLFVTVGTNPLDGNHPYVLNALERAELAMGLSPGDLVPPSVGDVKKPNPVDPGLTVKHTYKEIYIVDKIEVTTEAELDPFFYWMDDGDAAWFDRLVESKAQVKVYYKGLSGPAGDKTFTPKELQEKNDIWYNTLFGTDYADTVSGSEFWTTKVPFAVEGINKSSPKPGPDSPLSKNKNPQITISYRGAKAYIRTLVYTRPTTLTVTSLVGDIEIDMRKRDNDVGATDAFALDKMVEAVVTFTAFADTSIPAYLPVHISLTPGADTVNEDFVKPAGAYSVKGATGMIGAAGDGPADDNSEAEYYSNNFVDVSSNVKNNGKSTAVRFYYASPDYSTTGNYVEVGSRRVAFQLPVTWKNIQETP